MVALTKNKLSKLKCSAHADSLVKKQYLFVWYVVKSRHSHWLYLIFGIGHHIQSEPHVFFNNFNPRRDSTASIFVFTCKNCIYNVIA